MARGATCRADLLRLLTLAHRDSLMLDVDASGWFGYVRRPEQASPPERTEPRVVAPTMLAPVQERKLPLRLPFVHAIVQREPRTPSEPDAAAEAALAHASPIDEASAKAPSNKRLIGFEDLVPQARLVPALRRLLGATRTGELDVHRLTQQLAAGRLPRYLPRRIYQRWHPDLIVLFDFCPRLWPYRWDMHRLAARLLHHIGRSGVSLRIVDHGPMGPWSDWLAHQGRQSAADPAERPWRKPPAETPVLIVSDLGMLLGPQSAPARAWAEFVRDLIRAQVRPVALVPLGAGQLGAPVPPTLPVLRWSSDARPRPTRVHGTAVPQPDGLKDLLAMVAATRRVDPPLLRAMRRLNLSAPLNAGLEGALWCHADVEAVHTAGIRTEKREAHMHHFSERLPLLHNQLDQLRYQHHCHLRAVLNHEETLLWAAQVEQKTVARSRGAARRIEEARDFMRRLAATLTRPEGQSSAEWWSVAQGIVQRADVAMAKRYADLMNPLVAALVRTSRGRANVPGWADPAALAGLLDPDLTDIPCSLVRDAANGCLVLQAEPAGARQSPLGEALLVDAAGVRVSVAGRGPARWFSASALPVSLVPLREPAAVHLETAHESVLVAAVGRPHGALGWGCDKTGIAVRSAPIGEWDMRWSGTTLRVAPPQEAGPAADLWALEADAKANVESEGALKFGIDPRFGVYAELSVNTRHGSATQRLRWIEPGRFLMGSPDTEAGRDDNEGLRHEVTISNEFWLFDTPCTQALWRAVMGDNPSYFKSPDRPVEQVNWEDVLKFLKRINGLVPGLDLVLPTEAEWEYACRAGTETAIYLGDLEILGERNAPALDPIAWYGGNSGVDFDLDNGWDSADWPNKQYPHTRAGTRPVGLKEPNVWGLYDMLGNVWEWCFDGMRTYGSAAVIDPGATRVLRGGSWFNFAQYVRSAYRGALDPGYRNFYYGFRCARVQEGREPASGPEARKKKKRRGPSKPPEAAA